MKKGYSLIELLVVISIIGILTALALVALQGAKTSGRDARRRGDLEQIRSALEIYKSDCQQYPATLTFGSSLTANCPDLRTYMSTVPNDSQTPSYTYYYNRSATTTYRLCAYLEGGAGTACSGPVSCGAKDCNHQVIQP